MFFNYLFYILYALCIGPIIARVGWRYPLKLQAEAKMECRAFLAIDADQGQSDEETVHLFKPWSVINNVEKSWWHYLPVVHLFSRQPKTPFQIQAGTVELLLLLLACVICSLFGMSVQGVALLILITGFVILTQTDLNHQLLPDIFTLSLLWLGLLLNLKHVFIPSPLAVLSAAIAYLLPWIIGKVYYLLRRQEGMCHGDFKLYAVVGAWFGLKAFIWVFMGSVILGVCQALITFLVNPRQWGDYFAFGPAIMLACSLYFLCFLI